MDELLLFIYELLFDKNIIKVNEPYKLETIEDEEDN